ncbi:MAG: hypothetical protein ACTSRI_16425 [Promethearchaeota archaeon]
MKDIKNFRAINKIEKKIVHDSIMKISLKILLFLKKNENQLFISLDSSNSKNNPPFIYLVPKNLTKFINKINPRINIRSAGLYFGFIKKNIFFLSLEGAEYLFEKGYLTKDSQIFATEKGEKSILYGNKILKKMISKIPSTLRKNEFLFIFNQKKELIAIARSKVDYLTCQDLKPKEVIALNLNDKGYFLRKEQ